MASSLTVRVRISGLQETLRAFRELPRDATNELKTRTKLLATTLALQIRAAGLTDSGQSAIVAKTVRANRDRVPVITAGGMARVGRNRKPAYKVLFGSEFGATSLRQYRPHVGAGSYWFFKEVEHQGPRIDREWNAIADDVIRRWGGAR